MDGAGTAVRLWICTVDTGCRELLGIFYNGSKEIDAIQLGQRLLLAYHNTIILIYM